jgi:hypothetical protein
LRNIHYGVNEGHYERRYISSDPCKFIQGGMMDRGLYALQEEWDLNAGDGNQKRYPNPENFSGG